MRRTFSTPFASYQGVPVFCQPCTFPWALKDLLKSGEGAGWKPALPGNSLHATTQVAARSRVSSFRMKAPVTQFEDLAVWQAAPRFILYSFGGLFTGHPVFCLWHPVYPIRNRCVV